MERVRLAMDPFLGIGSSAMACKELNVSFLGFEIAKEYFDQSCERLTSTADNLKILS